MKTNAIIRIVLFGILVVVLLAVLLGALAIWFGTISTSTISTTSFSEKLNWVTENMGAGSDSQAEPGGNVGGDVSASSNDSGNSDNSGAVSSAVESDSSSQTADAYTVYADADTIQNLEIEWAAGTITISPSPDVTQIVVQEDSDAEYSMVCKTSGSKLEIKFAQGSSWWATSSKDLTIYVPTDWVCNDLEIDTAASTVYISDLTIRSVEYDGASGQCTFTNCSVTSLDLDTANGDVYFSGTLTSMECDAASASCYLVLNNTPRSIELDAASATLDLTLPEDCGFTVTLDALGSDFISDFQTTKSGSRYVYGSGACQIQVEGLSGSVIIRNGGAS